MTENKSTSSIAEKFEDFITSRIANGVRDSTIKSYRGAFLSIKKYIDVFQPLVSLRKSDIDKMIVGMRQKELHDTSIQTYTRCLKVFLSWAESEGYAVPSFKVYRADIALKTPYTNQELQRLLAAPPMSCDFWELRDWTIENFFLNSGCRAATLRNILVKDVDIENATITFRHTKNGRPQIMPLCAEMESILKHYIRVRNGSDDDVLFCNDHFQPLTQSALRKTIIKYNESRGVNKKSIHLFRHTFAKNFILNCGGDPFTLQYLLGHRTLEMTKRYCQLYNADVNNRFNDICPLTKILHVDH